MTVTEKFKYVLEILDKDMLGVFISFCDSSSLLLVATGPLFLSQMTNFRLF